MNSEIQKDLASDWSWLDTVSITYRNNLETIDGVMDRYFEYLPKRVTNRSTWIPTVDMMNEFAANS